MGGKPRKGYCVVGGVVPIWVRDRLDEIAREEFYGSRSQAIEHILTTHLERLQKRVEPNMFKRGNIFLQK